MRACPRCLRLAWRQVVARATCVVLLLLSLASASAAQTPARVHVGAGLGLSLLVGDASDFLDGGGSRYLQADFRITEDERFHVRIDGAFIGLDDDEGFGDIVAENGVALLTVGPQLTLPLGRWRPYGGLLVGSALVGRSVEGSFGGEEIDYEEGDAAFAFGGFAGLGFVLDEGARPVAIRIEGRVLDVGPAAFARAPDPADTSRPFGTIHEDFAVLGLRIGMTLGF
jgi:Outer membrane protein beta-barrel domain